MQHIEHSWVLRPDSVDLYDMFQTTKSAINDDCRSAMSFANIYSTRWISGLRHLSRH
jgi:hypothetical protein